MFLDQLKKLEETVGCLPHYHKTLYLSVFLVQLYWFNSTSPDSAQTHLPGMWNENIWVAGGCNWPLVFNSQILLRWNHWYSLHLTQPITLINAVLFLWFIYQTFLKLKSYRFELERILQMMRLNLQEVKCLLFYSFFWNWTLLFLT